MCDVAISIVATIGSDSGRAAAPRINLYLALLKISTFRNFQALLKKLALLKIFRHASIPVLSTFDLLAL